MPRIKKDRLGRVRSPVSHYTFRTTQFRLYLDLHGYSPVHRDTASLPEMKFPFPKFFMNSRGLHRDPFAVRRAPGNLAFPFPREQQRRQMKVLRIQIRCLSKVGSPREKSRLRNSSVCESVPCVYLAGSLSRIRELTRGGKGMKLGKWASRPVPPTPRAGYVCAEVPKRIARRR